MQLVNAESRSHPATAPARADRPAAGIRSPWPVRISWRVKQERLRHKVIEMAKEGDHVAMKLCMERIYPPRRERRLKLELPDIQTAGDVHAGLQVVWRGVGQGIITTGEAKDLTDVLEFGRKSVETLQLERRLTAVENAQKQKEGSDERRAA